MSSCSSCDTSNVLTYTKMMAQPIYLDWYTSLRLYEYLEYKDDNGTSIEVCFFFTIQSNDKRQELQISDKDFWPGISIQYATGKWRGSCIYHKQIHSYPSFIGHTHPIQSHSYPSVEDLFKVLKHQEILVSLIATRWGIWMIKVTPNTYQFNSVKNNTAKITEMMKKLDSKYLNQLYYLEAGIDKETQLSSSDYKKIQIIARDISIYLQLDVSLIRWDDIGIEGIRIL